MQTRAECSHEESGDDRSAGDAELHRHAHAGECERNASEDEAHDDSDEDREQVRIAELLSLVAENRTDVLDGSGFSYYRELVAELKTERTRRKEVYASSVDAGYVDSIRVSELERAELHSVQFRFGDQNLLRNQLAVYRVPVDSFLVPVHILLMSEKGLDALDIILARDHKQMLVLFDYGL